MMARYLPEEGQPRFIQIGGSSRRETGPCVAQPRTNLRVDRLPPCLHGLRVEIMGS